MTQYDILNQYIIAFSQFVLGYTFFVQLVFNHASVYKFVNGLNYVQREIVSFVSVIHIHVDYCM